MDQLFEMIDENDCILLFQKGDQIECVPFNSTIVTCELGNPLKENEVNSLTIIDCFYYYSVLLFILHSAYGLAIIGYRCTATVNFCVSCLLVKLINGLTSYTWVCYCNRNIIFSLSFMLRKPTVQDNWIFRLNENQQIGYEKVLIFLKI